MEKRLFATREKHGDDWKLYLPLLNYMHVYEKKYIREIICTAKIQIIKKNCESCEDLLVKWKRFS